MRSHCKLLIHFPNFHLSQQFGYQIVVRTNFQLPVDLISIDLTVSSRRQTLFTKQQEQRKEQKSHFGKSRLEN